jgi:hypothetical protein
MNAQIGQIGGSRPRRDDTTRPINKLTGELIKTYKNINDVRNKKYGFYMREMEI